MKHLTNVFNTSKPTPIRLKDIDRHIFNKAINIKSQQSNTLFYFENLRQELKIQTMGNLLDSKFLGDFTIDFYPHR